MLKLEALSLPVSHLRVFHGAELIFNGNSSHFRSFDKEDIIGAKYDGFDHVLKISREITVVDPSI